MSFGEYVNAGVFIQKNSPWDHHHTLQTSKPILKRDSARETYEKHLKTESRSFHQRVGPTYHSDRSANPTYRLAGLWFPPVCVSFLHQFSTAFESPSSPLIKVGASNGDRGSTRINDVVIPCPLLHLGLYIVATRRIRSRTLQCSRLVARE